jgi:hypothetical protein
MERKSFIYFADGTLRAGTADEPHEATDEEWSEAAHALVPKLDEWRIAVVRGALKLPPADR